uniref:Large ribosomal subunit protein eL14 n=1 Tax=Globodera rostochiensis TaxID=31243 RepID=A0A914GVI2_GLORO
MIYHRFVEIGRVVYIAKGKEQGKLAVIVNVIDGNKVLLDGPCSGVPRGVWNFKDLQLTKFTVPLRVGQRSKGVREAYEKAKIGDLWLGTEWAKRIAHKQKRASLTDFERFKVFKAKQHRNRLVRVEIAKLKKKTTPAAK